MLISLAKLLKAFALPVSVGSLLTLVVILVAAGATPAISPRSVNSGQHFFPPYANARDRFGFDTVPLAGYDVAKLHAGWYSNWGAGLNPEHPDQLVYVQLIRFTAGDDPHDPTQVTVRPNETTIARIAAAHPGSLWLMSNEPDSLYQGDPILPAVYAVVYHNFYEYIIGLDPTALFANGGIVQPTPCRLEYLDIVWDTFLETFGKPIPVDVWNVHAFILREVYDSWGASTPPGVDPSCGIDYAVNDADDIDILYANIKAMRTWMKDKGVQDRPLIVTEYGVLWPRWYAPQFTPARVSHFMTQTFNLFLYTTDPDVGYPADDHRLVQAWAWYSLSDDQIYNGHLFHSESKTLSLMGETYAAYTAALNDTPYSDLSARLIAARPSFSTSFSGTDTAVIPTLTVALTGSVSNLGKLPALDALARYEILLDGGGMLMFSHDVTYTVPARFDGIVALPPLEAKSVPSGRHVLRFSLDPEGLLDDPRSWNNVATTTLDLRPDLAVRGLDYKLTYSLPSSGSLMLTTTVQNQGGWPSPALSATLTLATWPEGTRIAEQALALLPLDVGATAGQVTHFILSTLDHELYTLAFELDPDDRVSEQDEGNNKDELSVPMALSATLLPTTTTILTSVTGAVGLVFPTGTVTMPTNIHYIPLPSADWETRTLRVSTTAFSLMALRDEQLMQSTFSRPVTVFWRYDDAGVAGLNRAHLRLFVLTNEGIWRDATCRPYRRDLDQYQLIASICHTGRFAYGNQYDIYLPLQFGAGLPPALLQDLSLFAPKVMGTRSPLLLPQP